MKKVAQSSLGKVISSTWNNKTGNFIVVGMNGDSTWEIDLNDDKLTHVQVIFEPVQEILALQSSNIISVSNHYLVLWNTSQTPYSEEKRVNINESVIGLFTNGEFIAYTTQSSNIVLVDVKTFKEIYRLKHDAVNHITFSSQKSTMISSSRDGNLMHWSTETGRLKKVVSCADILPEYIDISCVEYDPTGQYLAIVNNRTMVWIVDMQSNKIMTKLEHRSEQSNLSLPIWKLDFHELSKQLLTYGQGGVWSWDTHNWKHLYQYMFDGEVSNLSASKSTNYFSYFSSPGFENSLCIGNTVSRETIITIDKFSTQIWQVEFINDGTEVLYLPANGKPFLWDWSKSNDNKHALRAISISGINFRSSTISVDHNNRFFVIGGRHRIEIRSISDLDQDISTMSVPSTQPILCTALHPSSEVLLAINALGMAHYFDLPNMTTLDVFELSPNTTNVKFSPDGKYFAIITIKDELFEASSHSLQVWNFEQKQKWVGKNLDVKFRNSLAFHPYKSILAFAKTDTVVEVFDYQLNNVLHEIELNDAVFSMTFNPNGQYLYCATDNIIQVFKANDWNLISKYYSSSSAITDMRFTPSGRHLALSSMDGTVTVWQVKS